MDENARPLVSEEEERSSSARPSAGHHNPNRQSVLYCPYCGEETLFPAERGWECRSCLRAFSVAFLGLLSRERIPGGREVPEQ
jgi:hypothetical protein